MYDKTLRFFDAGDAISNEIMYMDGYPENLADVLAFLQSEGLVVIDRFGVRITESGRCRRRSGYVKELIVERVKLLAVALSIITAIVSLILLCLG